jgi:hypothetical protein
LGGGVVEAFSTSVRHGIDPVQFWCMTPFLTYKAITGLHRKMISQEWQGVVFNRQKKLKPLKEYLGKEAPPKDVSSKVKNVFAQILGN